MPPGGQGLNRKDPAVIKLMNQQKQMIVSMGQFLGEEVLHVMRGMERMETDVQIDGTSEDCQLPRPRAHQRGARRIPRAHTRKRARWTSGSACCGSATSMIGAVNAEVFNLIAQRLKRESPLRADDDGDADQRTARSGYIPNDAAYGMYTFEVLSSRLKPGCAETAIVNGILDLMSTVPGT